MSLFDLSSVFSGRPRVDVNNQLRQAWEENRKLTDQIRAMQQASQQNPVSNAQAVLDLTGQARDRDRAGLVNTTNALQPSLNEGVNRQIRFDEATTSNDIKAENSRYGNIRGVLGDFVASEAEARNWIAPEGLMAAMRANQAAAIDKGVDAYERIYKIGEPSPFGKLLKEVGPLAQAALIAFS